jgi:GNAT superfamily N-acetyltransferase
MLPLRVLLHVRLVAIEPDLQRQGHGRVLSDYVENYARRLGIKTGAGAVAKIVEPNCTDRSARLISEEVDD